MLLKRKMGGGVAATFIQILKTVFPIGDVVLARACPRQDMFVTVYVIDKSE